MTRVLTTILISCLLTPAISGQQTVDLRLTSQTATSCEISLYPSIDEISTLSNVVFTLKWRSDTDVIIGNPLPNSLITVSKSGPTWVNEGWRYQIFSGCGTQPGLISGEIKINIPISSNGNVFVASDSYVDQPTINGQYFVSIGGQNATGNILTSEHFYMQQFMESFNHTLMYYNPSTRQLYIERGGIFYNVAGQEVMVYNLSELLIVRKNAAQ